MDKQRMIRNLACAAALLAMLALSACSAPGSSAASEIAQGEAPAAPMSEPTAKPVPSPSLGAKPAPPPSLDADKGRACSVDSDCAIKDAGSCCGYRPVCVNKATPTFPEKVKAACANEGRVGICGFQAIDGCQCVAGKCKGVPMMENSVPLQ